MDLIPNGSGARLVYGLVQFEDRAPCDPSVTFAEYPIVAFQQDGKRLIPVTVAGPVAFWGEELRVSTSGAYACGVTSGFGIELPDGTRCDSRAQFERYAIAIVGARVREVRKQKGWPADRLPSLDEEKWTRASRDTAKRMYAEALSRLNDADVLAKSVHTQSDAPALLRILGFEVLLKCALRLSGLAPRKTHDYFALWQALPPETDAEIMRVARARMPGLADLSDLRRPLEAYRHVFERARYYYELHEGRTAEELHERARALEARGALVDEADVKYYPTELDCLIEGLREFIGPRVT